jgi:hypothetical protein
VKNRFQSLPFKCNLHRYTQVLNSVGSSLQVLDERFKANQGGGGDAGVKVTYVRGGKTLAVDVDPDGVDIA